MTMVTFAQAHYDLLVNGKVADDVAAARLRICTGREPDGTVVDQPCGAYKGEDQGYGSGHCRACGCPSWPISRMHRPGKIEPGKVWFPLACPAGKFPYHPGRRALLST